MGFFDYIIKNKTVIVNLEARDWKDAIRKGGALLLTSGSCKGSYIDAMIDGCERNGPYIVIGPGLAMPHARPETGVLETGYALVTLKKGVDFGDEENDPIDILVFMAAKDHVTHAEEAMLQVADFCDNSDLIMELRVCKTVEEVIFLLKRAQIQHDPM